VELENSQKIINDYLYPELSENFVHAPSKVVNPGLSLMKVVEDHNSREPVKS